MFFLPTPPAVRADLVMSYAVEDVVRRLDRGHAIPEPFGGLIANLGNDCYRCRERASRRLKAAAKHDVRWLFWGRYDRDPEIRLRCSNVLRDLSRCGSCFGSGVCRTYVENPDGTGGGCINCGQWSWSHFEAAGECRACNGQGFGWWRDPFEE